MKKGLFIIVFAWIIAACGDGNLQIEVDPNVQKNIDVGLIEDYLTERGFGENDIDTTSTGVRYVILDRGTGAAISESDQVRYTYVGQFLSDTIFDTNIQSIADSIRLALVEDSVGLADKSEHELYLNQFSEDRVYDTFFITYSSSGWNFPSGRGVADGFFNGIAETFNQLNVGGEVLLVLPSAEGYGEEGSGALIGPNEVLVFTLSPKEVEEQ
ncbi:FKBP-type peptidyl-prolyl cis-trans isomerase [Ekhidna sp.]